MSNDHCGTRPSLVGFRVNPVGVRSVAPQLRRPAPAQQLLDQRLAQGHSETVIESFDVPRS